MKYYTLSILSPLEIHRSIEPRVQEISDSLLVVTHTSTELNPIGRGVWKQKTDAKRGDAGLNPSGSVILPPVVLIHGNIYSNPGADQRTHRG
jgi:hypothetical protein